MPARQGSEKWPSFYERVIKFCERSLVLAGATTASRGLSQTCHISRDLNYFFTAIDRIRFLGTHNGLEAVTISTPAERGESAGQADKNRSLSAGSLQIEFCHSRFERRRLEPKALRRTAGAAYTPACGLEHAANVFFLKVDEFHRAFRR